MKFITFLIVITLASCCKADHPVFNQLRGLPPYFAKKYLRGDDYAAWAIQHNSRQDQPEGLVVDSWSRSRFDTQQFGAQTQLQLQPQLQLQSRSQSRTNSQTTIRPRRRSLPIMIYNPYVQPE